MKRVMLFLIFTAAFVWQYSFAGDTSDTVWTKNLWPDEIGDAKFTTDCSKVIAATTSNLLIIETITGDIVKSIPIKPLTFDSQPFVIDIDEVNNRFLVGALNGRVIIFDINTFDTLQSFHLLRGLWGVSFSKDIDKIYLVYSELEQTKNIKNLIIYDLKKNQVTDSLYDEGRTVNIKLNKTRDKFCTYNVKEETNWIYKVKLWDATTNKEIKELGVFNSEISDLAFSPDGKYLGVCKGFINIYDTETEELYQVISNIPETAKLKKFQFSQDSKYIVYHWTGYIDNIVVYQTSIYDLIKNEISYNYEYGSGRGIEVSNDNNKILINNGLIIRLLNAKWDSSPVIESNESNELILYPNPADNNVIIKFFIDFPELVNISIFNNKGKFVYQLFNDYLKLNENTFIWNSSEYPSGIYYCKITGKTINQTYKIIINK